MANHLKKAFEELLKEEKLRTKKKPSFLRKEKRLAYYSGWNKEDKPANKFKNESQRKLK